MKQVFEDYLFSQGYFVADSSDGGEQAAECAAGALVALARFADIRITAHPECASLDMLEVAKRNIGCQVPPSFYWGFPDSVRNLSSLELLFDQMLHYFRTYGMGDFSEAGHTLFEECYERAPFAESVEPKLFAIIAQDEAEELLARMAEGFVVSSRPLNDANYQLLKTYLETYSALPDGRCACKDTAARLILDTRDPDLACIMELPDVIRLVEWLLDLNYEGASIRKLNLKNCDRTLITAVLDRLFERGDIDVAACLEKKRVWNGLLYHLHYRPTCADAEGFCEAIRGKDRRSVYSAMERCLAKGDVRGAVDALHEGKGPGAVLRHLDHLLSHIDTSDLVEQREACDSDAQQDKKRSDSAFGRLNRLLNRIGRGDLSGKRGVCDSDEKTESAAFRADEDIAYVLKACETNNKILLVQLLLKHGVRPYVSHGDGNRFFAFTHLGKICKHRETDNECARRKTVLSAETEERVAAWLRGQLEGVCHGTLGKVYASEELRNVALPLQESASMGGFKTLPRGTRIPLSEGKKVRAFTYWEKVDDIDLSCLALCDDGSVKEYSWRNMYDQQSDAITFSGDQTSGYDGGSEFFDVDLARFSDEAGPECSYLVFCDNVYSKNTFDACICRAGYMVRDIEDSGKVFEPATVQTSFVVNCSSRSAFLFALDLRDPAIIWLSLGEHSMQRIAGEGDITFLERYLHIVDIMNLHDFACLLASDVVSTPAEADVVFSDEQLEALELRDDQELIRSYDTARILELLN